MAYSYDLRSDEKGSAKRKAPLSSHEPDSMITAQSGAASKGDSPKSCCEVLFPRHNSLTQSAFPKAVKLQKKAQDSDMPGVTCSKSDMHIREFRYRNASGHVFYVQYRGVVEHASNPKLALDADAMMVLPECQELTFKTPTDKKPKVHNLAIDKSVLILRQDFFMTQRNGLKFYPRFIFVSGRKYSVHRILKKDPYVTDTAKTTYCYAVPFCAADGDFQLVYRSDAAGQYLRKKGSNGIMSKGYKYSPLFEPRNHFIRGRSLHDAKYGEVYRAHLLTQLPDCLSPTYDNSDSNNQKVAAKIVRHLNDHCGEVGTEFYESYIGNGNAIPPVAPTHHAGSDGVDQALTTAHMHTFFEKQNADSGCVEDVSREVEMMALVQSEVSDSAKRLLVPLIDFAICPNNLYVLTPYLPLQSLCYYQHRDDLNHRISEDCARHVAYQLFAILRELHQLHIAHRDISVENIVLSVAQQELQAVLGRLRDPNVQLSYEEFRTLEVKLIDLGQAVRHAANPASIPLNQSFDTVTTVESVSSCAESTASSPLAAAQPLSSVSSSSVSVGDENTTEPSPPLSSPLSSPSVPCHSRGYHLLITSSYPVGKIPSLCPEHESILMRSAGRPAVMLEYCGLCVDMWQMGMLILFLVSGRAVFSNWQGMVEWMDRVRAGRQSLAELPVDVYTSPGSKYSEPLSEHVTPLCLDLLQSLLCANPADRLTVQQALNHPWFDSYLRDLHSDADRK